MNSYPKTVFEGAVIEMNPAVDPLTRSAMVRIGVNNTSGRLKAGMFAQGEILTGVQQQAIRRTGRGRSIAAPEPVATRTSFVVENGKASRRAVRIGRETDGKLEITDGLKPGDLLIAEQRIELADGVGVTPGK